MMKNMTFFIKKLLPKNYDSAAEDSPSHKINDSAIFQNLRETVERDEEIINVSFCNFHIFDCNKISATFLYAKLFCKIVIAAFLWFLAIATKKNRHRTSITKWLCFICKFYSYVWLIQYESYCYIFICHLRALSYE